MQKKFLVKTTGRRPAGSCHPDPIWVAARHATDAGTLQRPPVTLEMNWSITGAAPEQHRSII